MVSRERARLAGAWCAPLHASRQGIAALLVVGAASGGCVTSGGADDVAGDDDDDTPTQCDPLDATTCAGETICLAGACVAAFGRTYDIIAFDAVVPQFTPAGETWDAAGGAPDPFAVLSLNGVAIGATSTVQDNFTPQWNEFATAVIAAGSGFRIDVFEEDLTANDGVIGCAADPLTADLLHEGYVYCTGALGDVTVFFVTR